MVETLVDLAAQPAHMDVDHVGLGVEVVAPDMLQQHRARHHLARVAHEVGQQVELTRLQGDLAAGTPHRAGEQIQLQVREAETRLAGCIARAPEQRFKPRQELGEGEGLGQIVVAAGPEPLHPVVHLGERAQDQHRRAPALASQRLDQRKPVQPRQHAVDHECVEAVVEREREPVRPVMDELDHVAALGQALLQVAGGLDIVFDDQHVHGCNLGRPRAAIKGLKRLCAGQQLSCRP